MSKDAIIDAIGKVDGLEGKDDLIKEIESTYDSAGAKDKVQEANKDLTSQREAWETKEKELKGQIDTLQGKIVSGGSDDKSTALQSQLDSANEKLESLTNRLDTDKTERQTLARSAKESELKGSIIAAAGSDKAKAVNPNQVYALMQAEGLVSLDDENKPIINRVKDGKKENATADEAVEAFLEANTHLVAASGNRGSGDDNKGGSSTGEFDPLANLSNPKLR